MILSFTGHNFRYETENVIRIFFPLEKITVTDEMPETQENHVFTYMKNGIIGCEVFISGKEEKREQSILNKTDKDAELILAQLLYDILTSMTGLTPPWGILTGVRPSKLLRNLIAENGETEAVDYFRNQLYVTDKKTDLALSVAKAEDRIIALSGEKSYSLYVSIPFCPTRCSYCSFVSHSVAQAKKLIPDYVKLLCKEIADISKIASDLGLEFKDSIYSGEICPKIINPSTLES